jgi:ribosomal protein L31
VHQRSPKPLLNLGSIFSRTSVGLYILEDYRASHVLSWQTESTLHTSIVATNSDISSCMPCRVYIATTCHPVYTAKSRSLERTLIRPVRAAFRHARSSGHFSRHRRTRTRSEIQTNQSAECYAWNKRRIDQSDPIVNTALLRMSHGTRRSVDDLTSVARYISHRPDQAARADAGCFEMP